VVIASFLLQEVALSLGLFGTQPTPALEQGHLRR
jgi:hypothetical protein